MAQKSILQIDGSSSSAGFLSLQEAVNKNKLEAKENFCLLKSSLSKEKHRKRNCNWWRQFNRTTDSLLARLARCRPFVTKCETECIDCLITLIEQMKVAVVSRNKDEEIQFLIQKIDAQFQTLPAFENFKILTPSCRFNRLG